MCGDFEKTNGGLRMVGKLSDEQLQIKKMVGDLAKEKFAPNAKPLEDEGLFPAENFKQLASLGLMGLMLPPAFGGVGADTNSYLIAVEEIAKGCAATAFLYNTHLAASLSILAMGSEEQKAKYLQSIASGEKIVSLAGTEAGGGTNPFACKTFAKKDGNDYILNGTKVYISGAGESDLYLVLVKTSDAPGPNSLSMFMIEKDTPGFTFGSMENKLGLRSLPTGELVFENCRVSSDALLGKEGSALQVFGVAAGLAALGAGAISLGLAQAAVDATKQYIVERTVLNQKLAEIGVVQEKFANMLIELNASRSLLYKAAFDRENSAPGPVPTILQAKINTTEKALRIIDDGIQLHGAYGYSEDFPLEKYYRDARALTIHFGNNDVLRSQVSKLVLGI